MSNHKIKLTEDNHFIYNRVFPLMLIIVHLGLLTGSLYFLFVGFWPMILIYGIFFGVHFFLAKAWRYWLIKEVYWDDGTLLVNEENGLVSIDKESIEGVSIKWGITELKLFTGSKIYFILGNKDNIALFER